ncbi:prepilin-type N-terminal cleavage/methylation domain-containing protein [Campylobacter sp. JMF_06 NA1]|uniref:type IV pilin protein n=1 Tax=Campylobacter sp. JMF_06 NA1 TaxID=2983823 RepID=UPI0022E9BC13|nr:prepilin-type N-terminal cleavage/methylation domain-containing protein [Campylobacter sp. JMF_06 NA1]MDA3077942.1 prepilin-type N-terminal cleavage/methylation domain-containing protein [Campylobacter sp. JMF_06 NA1]
MRKGFTMIELIFVIVILGILAAVAIPRLAATRDDAELSKAATNLSTVVSDITAYYTAKTSFSNDVKDMTNVSLGTGTGTISGNLQIKGANCINIEAVEAVADTVSASGTITQYGVPAYVHLTKDGTNSPLCDSFAAIPAVAKMLAAEPIYGKKIKSDGTLDTSAKLPKGSYPVGGSNVVY